MMPIVGLAGKAGAGKSAVSGMLCKRGGVAIAQADPIKRFAFGVLEFTEHQLWGPSEARNAPDPRSAQDILDLWKKKENGLEMISWLESVGLGELHYRHLERWAHQHVFGVDNISARTLLQTLGSQMGRAIDSQIWVNLAQTTAMRLLSEPGQTYSHKYGIVNHISSAPNEFVVISDVRFRNEVLTIKQNGGMVVNVTGPDAVGLLGQAGQHVSEKELDSIPSSWYDAILVNDKAHGLERLETAVANLGKALLPKIQVTVRT